MNKRHGLWAFHRVWWIVAPKYKWWVDDDLYLGLKKIYWSEKPPEYTKIVRCSNRYFRKHGIIPNARMWNEMCLIISQRMNARRQTEEAALIFPNRPRPLIFSNEFTRPILGDRWGFEPEERLKRWRSRSLKRIDFLASNHRKAFNNAEKMRRDYLEINSIVKAIKTQLKEQS